ncbi:UNVERIFIED_CONTAM: Tfp pilus assembly protein PilO [Brevibacillus sp. OAP136]
MTISRQTLLLVLMLFFLAGGAFYYFTLMPLKAKSAQLSADLEKEESYLAALKKADVKNKGQEVATLPPKFQNQVPEAPYLEQIMLDMTRLQTVSGVEMDGIGLSNSLEITADQTGQGKPKATKFTPIGKATGQEGPTFTGLENVSISTKITGSYAQVHRFFQEVNQLPRVIRIDQVKITSNGGNNLIELRPSADVQKFTADVTMEAFFSPALAPYFPNRLPIVVAPPAKHVSPFE